LPANEGFGGTPWPLSPWHAAQIGALAAPAAASPAACAAPDMAIDAMKIVAINLSVIAVPLRLEDFADANDAQFGEYHAFNKCAGMLTQPKFHVNDGRQSLESSEWRCRTSLKISTLLQQEVLNHLHLFSSILNAALSGQPASSHCCRQVTGLSNIFLPSGK
jgi:hypothetical protein